MGALVFQSFPDPSADTAPLHTSFMDEEVYFSSHGDLFLWINKEMKLSFHYPGAFFSIHSQRASKGSILLPQLKIVSILPNS